MSASCFRVLRIQVLEGGTCSADQSAPLPSKALVPARSATVLSGESPISHAITSPDFPAGHTIDIVGVVSDVRESGLVKEPEPTIYWCGYSAYLPDVYFLVRTNAAGAGAPSLATIRAALLEIEPKRAMYAVRLLVDALSASVSQQRLNTILLAPFGAAALLLAAMGLYGVLSQLVAGRRREPGYTRHRHPHPGPRGELAPFDHRDPHRAGLSGALVLAQFMSTLVFGITTRDPLTFAAVPLVLALVAAIASILPARRAAAVDPIDALRQE